MSELTDRISKAMINTLEYKGATIKHNNEIIYLDKEEIRIGGKNFDDTMVTYVIAKMIEEGKILFVGDCDADVIYLRKLVGLNELCDEGKV